MEEIRLTDAQITSLARPILAKLPEIEKFYEDEKNMAAFREWHFKRYGFYPKE